MMRQHKVITTQLPRSGGRPDRSEPVGVLRSIRRRPPAYAAAGVEDGERLHRTFAILPRLGGAR